jgi:hypothetical protein
MPVLGSARLLELIRLHVLLLKLIRTFFFPLFTISRATRTTTNGDTHLQTTVHNSSRRVRPAFHRIVTRVPQWCIACDTQYAADVEEEEEEEEDTNHPYSPEISSGRTR